MAVGSCSAAVKSPRNIAMHSLKLALDWTPNINHIGFFVAQEMGHYDQEGVQLDIVSPETDGYRLTPAKKLELGEVDFALCPTESLLSFRTKSSPFSMIAIATLLQCDLSAIVSLQASKISRPRDLDGKIYSSYKARYEDQIVREMIRNDGGRGLLKCVYPAKLGIWNTLLSGQSDATWIFLNWEGVEASATNTQLHFFKLADFGIPYSYSPVIAAGESSSKTREEAYKAFLKATKRGFLFCRQNPQKAVGILRNHIPLSDAQLDLEEALKISIDAFGDESSWGSIGSDKLQVFLNWIYEMNLETQKVSASDIFTNRFLS